MTKTVIESDSIQRIRDSALAEIRKTGILGLRVADVASGADVSVPLIYKYFDDRDGLLAEVLGEVIERHFEEELTAIRKLLEVISAGTAMPDVLKLMPQPDDKWRRERRWLRLEAKAAAQEIPALRKRISVAMANVEQATTLLIEKARSISGNQSKVPARTIAWMIIALSDGFTNNDLSKDPISDEQYEPLIRDLLTSHVF
jgi:AcrR family transcriptional regulator